MMEYTIVTAQSVAEIIEAVNHKILLGWIPQGGICESGNDQIGEFYVQAMIMT